MNDPTPVTSLERLQAAAEAAPNQRVVEGLRHGQRLGVTRHVRRAFGRVSKPYAGLEEFVWTYEVYTPALDWHDAAWPHIAEEARGWRALQLGREGEREARRLLSGELWEDILASRPTLRSVGAR
jgi:hypothetical protein